MTFKNIQSDSLIVSTNKGDCFCCHMSGRLMGKIIQQTNSNLPPLVSTSGGYINIVAKDNISNQEYNIKYYCNRGNFLNIDEDISFTFPYPSLWTICFYYNSYNAIVYITNISIGIVVPSNVITYKASEKLPETTSSSSSGLHTNAFGDASISSHTFSNGTGTITFNKDVSRITDGAFYKCSGLTSITIPSSVMSIGFGVFYGCSGLTSITIPSSVTSIGNYEFGGCCSLTNITIPSSVTTIGDDAFFGCSGLTSITIPSSVTSIGYHTFDGCSRLQQVHVGWNDPLQISSDVFGGTPINSATLYIPKGAFAKYATANIWKEFQNITEEGAAITADNTITYMASSKLTVTTSLYSSGLHTNAFGDASICSHTFSNGTGTITFSKDITQIGKYAFYKCSGMTSVTIPSSVTSIGEYAFSGCSGLTNITIPSSVTSIGGNAFDGCSGLTKAEFSCLESLISIAYSTNSSNPLYYAKNLYINGKEIREIIIPKSIGSISKYAFSGYSGIAAVPVSLKSMAISAGISNNKLFVYDDFKNNSISYIKGFECFEPTPNPDLIFTDLKPYITYNNIKFFLSDGNELPYTKNENGAYLVKGLPAGSNNRIKVTYTDGKGDNQSCEFSITTKAPKFSITTSVTQSTVTVKTVTAETDLTCTPTNPGIEYNYDKHNNLPAIINGLCPEQSVKLYPFAYYDGELYRGSYKEIKTSEVAPTVSSNVNITASSLEISGYYTKGDATITDEQFEVNGKVYKGNKIIATGLDPNTRYSVSYRLKANGKQYSGTRVFTTAALSMKTMQPKVISAGNVIVAAEANLDEAETNVGFEWRRTDWTDDFASNTGSAYMYGGQMEGYIRNLYTEKLWKYRPYYLSDNGMYYYGDWMGVDPTNTSYFEATVHTYSTIKIEGNTALVKGYALRGTDDIKVQGFVYWKRVSNTRTNNGRMFTASLPADAKTVEASGQIMTATLSNLDYDSEYSYMVFVTTTEGETFYGEEQTFSIGSDITGIEPIYDNGNESLNSTEVVGYYDLNGRRIPEPQRGVNIVRYANGTSRKLFKK